MPHSDIPGAAVLAVMLLVSALVRDSQSKGAATSFTTVILLACVPLFGPTVAGVLGLVTALGDRTYRLSIVSAFNALMIGTMAITGGIAYVSLGGPHPVPDGLSSTELLFRVGVPLVAADLVMCAVNVLVLGGMMAITGGNTRDLLVGSVRQLVPLYLGYASIAFVFVLLWGPAGVGPLSAVLIAAPLAIARFVYVQYGDEVRAHQRILGMFVRAADGPDGRLAAHAARVSELCQLIAGHLGLGDADRQILGYAAHLHDLGMKAVVRATDTQRGGSGPYTNVRALLPHPDIAADAVSRVHFLAPAAATIRAHHERLDGRGYPEGLAGEEIPLTARILAVADAFDALTTTRGERAALDKDDALAELQLSSGSHLDPRILGVLATVLRGRAWPRRDDPLNEGSWLWDHHTLPAMSDVIADEIAATGLDRRGANEPRESSAAARRAESDGDPEAEAEAAPEPQPPARDLADAAPRSPWRSGAPYPPAPTAAPSAAPSAATAAAPASTPPAGPTSAGGNGSRAGHAARPGWGRHRP